jgi:hypothetical protein
VFGVGRLRLVWLEKEKAVSFHACGFLTLASKSADVRKEWSHIRAKCVILFFWESREFFTLTASLRGVIIG